VVCHRIGGPAGPKVRPPRRFWTTKSPKTAKDTGKWTDRKNRGSDGKTRATKKLPKNKNHNFQKPKNFDIMSEPSTTIVPSVLCFFERTPIYWGHWPEDKPSRPIKMRAASPPRSQRFEVEEDRRAAVTFARAVIPEVIDLTADDSDEEGSVHTLLDSDLEDPYAVSDSDEPPSKPQGPYPTAAQDWEYYQMQEDNEAIKDYVYEPGIQYSPSLIASLKRPFAELVAVDEFEKRSKSAFLLSDSIYGVDAVLGETVPNLDERVDRLAEEAELSKEDADYVLHCWDFPGMDGYSLFELEHWYVSAETIHRSNGQYFGTPIGGRKQVRLGAKFPIHRIHPEYREEINSILVDYDKNRK
jgi:hypothetical protein